MMAHHTLSGLGGREPLTPLATRAMSVVGPFSVDSTMSELCQLLLRDRRQSGTSKEVASVPQCRKSRGIASNPRVDSERYSSRRSMGQFIGTVRSSRLGSL